MSESFSESSIVGARGAVSLRSFFRTDVPNLPDNERSHEAETDNQFNVPGGESVRFPFFVTKQK
jgi:hypothetical protein